MDILLICLTACVESVVRVSDGRFSDTEPLTICISGENLRPYWVGEPYIASNVASSVANNTVLLTVQARDDDLQGSIVYQVRHIYIVVLSIVINL